MSDDIANRLRNKHADDLLAWEAADEIERLRKELGQVDDADSWVSQTDAANLDSLLNWCEFNAMEWHRALARLVNDRARLRGEVNRIRELSGDAGKLRAERDEARRMYCEKMSNISRQQKCTPQWFAEEEGWDCFEEVKK